jgi:hypothetical protein
MGALNTLDKCKSYYVIASIKVGEHKLMVEEHDFGFALLLRNGKLGIVGNKTLLKKYTREDIALADLNHYSVILRTTYKQPKSIYKCDPKIINMILHMSMDGIRYDSIRKFLHCLNVRLTGTIIKKLIDGDIAHDAFFDWYYKHKGHFFK